MNTDILSMERLEPLHDELPTQNMIRCARASAFMQSVALRLYRHAKPSIDRDDISASLRAAESSRSGNGMAKEWTIGQRISF